MKLPHPRRAPGGRVVPRRADRAAGTRVVRRTTGERRLLREALGSRRLHRHLGADGVVYRYFGGHCFRFHPLANFGVLNARATSGDVEGTQELADALVARGVYQQGGGIGWEYDFPFSGGKAPWLSGMAQAVAAQAFSRAATTVPEEATTYMNEATAAFRVIPKRLMTSVAAGPWIRLYAFSSLTVLNAQLQATISLQAYAAASEDPQAQALAARMQNAAAASLARFDTGYWSYYALPREPSPITTATGPVADEVDGGTALRPPPPTRFASRKRSRRRSSSRTAASVRAVLVVEPATVVAVTAAGASRPSASPLLGGCTPSRGSRSAQACTRCTYCHGWNGHTLRSTPRRGARRLPARSAPVKPSSDDETGTSPLVVANRATVELADGATAPGPGRCRKPGGDARAACCSNSTH